MNTNFKTFKVDMWAPIEGEQVPVDAQELVVESHWTMETLQKELDDNPPDIEFDILGNTFKVEVQFIVTGVKR